MKGLTEEEQENVRNALRFLRVRVGSWGLLAKAVGFTSCSMINTKKGTSAVSVNMAFQVSRLAGVTFDDVIAGRYPAKGTCPYCGRGPH